MATGIQFHFRQKTYFFRLKMGFFILSLFFFLVFCLLGVWQFHRYHEKKILLTQYQERLTASPIPLIPLLNEADRQFQQVFVKGQFDHGQTVLIQNQLQQGRLGYEVLTPFRIPGEKKLLLVDRGWLPKENINAIPTEKNTPVRITGYIKSLDSRSFILGKNIYDVHAAPLIMQRIDLKELSGITQQTFFPFILRLNSQENDGLTRHWIITAITPEKHLGYTIQWFVMAIVLLIAFFCFCCEQIKHDPTK